MDGSSRHASHHVYVRFFLLGFCAEKVIFLIFTRTSRLELFQFRVLFDEQLVSRIVVVRLTISKVTAQAVKVAVLLHVGS